MCMKTKNNQQVNSLTYKKPTHENQKGKVIVTYPNILCFCQRPNGWLVMDGVDREDKEIGTNDGEQRNK